MTYTAFRRRDFFRETYVNHYICQSGECDRQAGSRRRIACIDGEPRHGQPGESRLRAFLAHAGDTVNVPIPPVLVANNIAEGGTVNPQNPNLGNAQIVLNTHAEATFQIPDVTKALAFPELLEGLHAAGGGRDCVKVEHDFLNLYSQFTANHSARHGWHSYHGSCHRLR